MQTLRELVVATEDVGSPRIVHLAGSPPPAVVTTYEGWSQGRWEGDTLVVETTHVRADNPVRPVFGGSIMLEPDSKLVERVDGDEVIPGELLALLATSAGGDTDFPCGDS